jgi:hypothetical protein
MAADRGEEFDGCSHVDFTSCARVEHQQTHAKCARCRLYVSLPKHERDCRGRSFGRDRTLLTAGRGDAPW